jgi:hypothetical protein
MKNIYPFEDIQNELCAKLYWTYEMASRRYSAIAFNLVPYPISHIQYVVPGAIFHLNLIRNIVGNR